MAWVEDRLRKTFSLDQMDGTVNLAKTLEIPPFSPIQVHGITKVKGYDKKVNIIVEPKNNVYNSSVPAVPSYTHLKPGSSKVNMNLRNLTSKNCNSKSKVSSTSSDCF